MSRTRRQSRVVDGVHHWLCSKCEEWLPASAFHRRKRAASGLASRCKACASKTERVAHGLMGPKAWGVGLPRRGSDWVADARADEGPGVCVVGGEPLSPGRRVLCGSKECARVYHSLHRQELRVKDRERRALDTPLPRSR